MKPCVVVILALAVQVANAESENRKADTNDARASQIRFRSVTICDSFPAGYQVAVADMNNDGRPDILAP